MAKKQGFFKRLFGAKEEATTGDIAEAQIDESQTIEANESLAEQTEFDRATQEDLDTQDDENLDQSKLLGDQEGTNDEVLEDQQIESPQETETEQVENSESETFADQTPETIASEATVENQPLEAETPDLDDTPVSDTEPSDPTSEDSGETSDLSGEKKGWFTRLKEGLSKSSTQLTSSITSIFTKRKLDEDTLEELEDVLIQADLGVETSISIVDAISKDRFNKEISEQEVRDILAEQVQKVLDPVVEPLKVKTEHKPHVILVVGVNGTGKTTTIGKLAAKYKAEGKKITLAAGDTFRAAAIEQLKIWGERTGSEVISGKQGADAAGLAFDAVKRAKEQNSDLLLMDTAGRLQNKANLMAELEKIVRVIKKQDETAPHDVVLVLDATTGQNAMQQVETFKKICGVTGLVMTKLDGTARGGILVAISAKHGLPVHAIGIGEGIDDLQPFSAEQFAQAIAGNTTGEQA